MKRPKRELPAVEQTPVENLCTGGKCCPDHVVTPELPSPTSCLPAEELGVLKKEMKAANELLLSLALEEGQSSGEAFRKAFAGLDGLQVKVLLETGEAIEGKVYMTGFDFVGLRDGQVEIILPFVWIAKIMSCGRFAEPDDEPALTEIGPCFRRALTFEFGEVVASSPELIQQFFGMHLNIYLLLFIAKRIEITLKDTVLEGFVTDADKETVVVKVDTKHKVIPLSAISMIKYTLE